MSAAEIQRLAKFFLRLFFYFFSMSGKYSEASYPLTHLPTYDRNIS